MKKAILLVAVSMIFFACEKVIDVDLNSADPQTAIEANLREGEDSLRIEITNTADYFGTDDPKSINNAEIELINGDGQIYKAYRDSLTEGIYWIDTISAGADNSYKLNVYIDGELTEAEAFMPPVVEMDTLYFEFVAGNDFFEDYYSVFLGFQDPGTVNNYYRIVVNINGEEDENIIVIDDRFNQGKYIEIPLVGLETKKGDLVFVELRSIDEYVYEYYVTLNSILGQTGPPGIAPGNPITNLKGAVKLGYFGAYSHSGILDTIE